MKGDGRTYSNHKEDDRYLKNCWLGNIECKTNTENLSINRRLILR
jgi:hypothetical protein